MNFTIAIPTHIPEARADKNPRVFEKTMKYLDTVGSDAFEVIIVCNTELDQQRLEKFAIHNMGNDTRLKDIVCSNSEGLHGNRNYIRNDLFPNNSKVIMMDDDIDYISKKEGTKLTKINDFIVFKNEMKKVFDRMTESEYYPFKYCGTSAVHNAFYMSEKEFSENLLFCAGPLQFLIIDTEYPMRCYIEELEDSLWTLAEYCRHRGRILRANHIVPKTKWYDPNGGMSGNDERFELRRIDAQQNCNIICNDPHLRFFVSEKTKKVRGKPFCNIRFNHKHKWQTYPDDGWDLADYMYCYLGRLKEEGMIEFPHLP